MTTWNEPVTAWSNDLQAGGAAADTVRLYRTYLARWARVCDRPNAATHEAIVAWLAGHEWQPETRKSARTAVQSFYRWAHRRGLLSHNPAADLPAIRIPEATPRPAPDSDIRAALARARADVQLMILLGSVDGLRRAEIARVHTTDVDADDMLTVRGKGGKVRRVPLPPALARAIRELPPGWVFPSPVRAGKPITPGCAGRWMSQVLPPGVTPHMLRHAAATSMHEDDGLSLLEIRRQLGHANVSTTQRYVAVQGRRTRAAMAARAGRLAS